jgi:murein DD-endopeptidase MepM/ murein hydrolase activator NlpD
MAYTIGSGYDTNIGTRQSSQAGTLEYYNKVSGAGFENPDMLAQYVNSLNPTAGATSANVFDVVSRGFTPTQVINQAQQAAFNQIKATPSSDPNVLREQANEIIGSNVNDIQTQVKGYQTQLDSLLGNVSSFFQQSENEQKLTTQLNNLDSSYERGINAILDNPETVMRVAMGEQDVLDRQYTQKRNNLVRQLQSETSSRQQKLEAAKFLYDATRNRLSDTIQLMQATAPESIANSVDSVTGEMTVIMRNPLTGEITRRNLGQVQTPQKWTENVALAQEAGVTTPFFSRDGRTIINTNSGREYSTPEQFFADGGSFDPTFMKRYVTMGVQSLQRQQYERGVFESDRAFNRGVFESDRSHQIALENLNLNKKGNWTTTEDTNGNKVLLNTTTGQQVPMSAPAGKTYSQLYGGRIRYDSPYGGADIDLKKGDPVYTPVSGEVIFVGPNGGYGNQIKIRDDNGNEVWLAHLDSGTVQVGQRVSAGQLVGIGGNTGNVISGKGGDGSHLDIRVVRNGKEMSMQDSIKYVDEQYAKSNTGDIESRLKSSAGTDGKVDPTKYLLERQKAKISPDEFDKRYGYLLSPQEQKNLGIAGGTTAQATFLNANDLKTLFTPDKLATSAKEAGYTIKRRLAPDLPDVDGYLKSLESTIEQYRQAGFTDNEILKLMQK